ncbi:hypothetical protein Tco_1504714 [Tanacetum coccineum]
MPFPSRLKKQKKDDDDERLLSIFRQIHINLPFLEAMIHIRKEPSCYPEKLSPRGRRPREFHATMSYQTFGSKKCSVLEMDEDELVPIILGWPFLATDRAVIDVHERKLSLRVKNETITLNIGKSIKSKYSRNDYLYCADHTAKLVQEQWIKTIDHDGKWVEVEEEGVEPSKLELKELPEHLEYAFLQENNQILVVISSALSAIKKTRLLEVLRNHKGAIAWSIADIKRLFPGKLKSRWYGPFAVSKDMKNGAIKLYEVDGNEFIVNKQRVKPYKKDALIFDKDDDITLADEGEVT